MKIEKSKIYEIDLKYFVGEDVFDKLGGFYQQPTHFYQEFKQIKESKVLEFTFITKVLIGELAEDSKLVEMNIDDYLNGVKSSVEWILNLENQ